MENMEIILVDFTKTSIDVLVFDELGLRDTLVSGSHFYDNRTQADVQWGQIESLTAVLSPKGSGNIVVDRLQLGTPIANVIIALSFDEETGDVVFNFPETELLLGDTTKTKLNLSLLLAYLLRLKGRFDIPKIVIGFEPAMDEDCLLLEIGGKPIEVDEGVQAIMRRL